MSAGLTRQRSVVCLGAASVLLAFVVLSAVPVQAQTGLVAAYGFDEGAGGTAGDASGNGNTATVGGATWTTGGKYGGALSFNGAVKAVIADSASLRLTTGMTLEAWVKPSTVSGVWRDVIYKGNDVYYLEGTTPTNNAPAVGVTLTTSHSNTYGPSGLAVNTWTHLAATYDGSTVRLYVNGTQVASTAQSGPLTSSTQPLEIGGDSIYGQYFQGVIDEVRVYNVALTAAQIQSDMTTPVSGGGTALPDLTITKTHTGSFTQGQTGATYTLTVGNSGTGGTSGTVTVVDTLPSGLTATALSGPGWTCTVATLTCTRNDALAAAASYPVITVTVSVAGNAPASVTNSATVSGGGDTNTANNSASDPTTIAAPTAGLVAAYGFDEGAGGTAGDASGNGNTATVGGATWTTGGKYGGALSFNGAVKAVIADSASLRLTTGMTLEAWVKPSTVSGVWRDVIYKGNDVYYLEGTTPTNNAPAVGVTLTTSHSNTYGPSGLAVNTWTHLAATYDGSTVRLYVNGTQVASTAQSGPLTSSTQPLEIGGDGIYGQYFQGVIDEVRVYNVALPAAQIQSDMTTPVSGGGTALPDLTITKTHSGNFTQGQTGASYTLTVRNSGTAATSGTVTVVDTLPAGLTGTTLSGTGWSCTVGTVTCTRSDALAAAASYPVITVTVSVSASAPASVTNTASVSGGGDTNAVNDSATDVTAITQLADLTITKTHTGSFTQGQAAASYTLTVSNSGTGATSGTVTVGDTLPSGLTATALSGPGWTCTVATLTCARNDALAAAASYPVITVTVSVAGNAPASVTNSATVSGGGDTNTANNSASDPTTIAAPTAGLVAAYGFDEGAGGTAGDASGNGNTATVGGATWTTGGKYGGALSFNGAVKAVIADSASLRLTTGMTLEAWVKPSTVSGVWRDVIYKGNDVYYLEGTTPTNNAPAVGVTLTTSHSNTYGPSGLAVNTWTHLAATYDGSTVRLYVNGTQVASTAQSGPLTSSTQPLEIGGDGIYGQYFQGVIDEVRVYNVALPAAQIQSDMTTPVSGGGTALPDLTITKTHSGNFTQGQTGASYTLTVRNSGTAATSGTVTVVDTLPAGLTGTTLSGTGWSCTVGTVTCTRSDALAAAASYPVITVTVSVSASAPASVTNTASVSGGGDTNAVNDSATDVTAITQLADLTITKTHTGSFTQGQAAASYTLTVSNSGTGATSGTVTVGDTLPSGLTATALSGPGWTCTVATLTCARNDALAAAASYPVITVTVSVAGNAPASVTNSATVSGGGDTNTANNSATDPTTIGAIPDLTITKTHTGSFTQGQTGASYTLTVNNSGAGATSGTVTVVDTLPSGLTATAISGTGWICTVGTLTCTRGDALAPAASYPVITLTVSVFGSAPASVTNTATVSGGGETNTANDSASDPTTITQMTTGLVAAYSFDQGSGSTATDASGNGHAGSIGSASWTTSGKFGSALVFNGTSALVTVPDASALDLSTGMTVEAWVNPSIALTGWRDVVYKGDDIYMLEASTDLAHPAAGASFGPQSTRVDGPTALAANIWTHLAMTYDRTALRLFVNGTEVASSAQTRTISSSTRPLEIGGDSIYGQFFRGTIDEVRIYNVALTAAQIQADMNAAISPVVPDTEAPTVPGTLAAIASGTQVSLSWTASTDNVGVTGYLLERCQDPGCTNFVQITSLTGGAVAYTDTGLAQGTTFRYRVRAVDAQGNLSDFSHVASATTQGLDGEPPSAPGTLTALVISGTQVNLSWEAATDNIGIAGYRVERCQGAGCSIFVKLATATGTTFVDTALTPNTQYTYVVRASDTAGNLGPYSNTSTVTTAGNIPELVAAYAFNENAGTIALDLSGHGNDATLVSSTWTANGKFGNAMAFNGVNARLTVADSPSLRLTSGMTLEAWVRPSVVDVAWRDVIYKGDDNYYLEASGPFNTAPSGNVQLLSGNAGRAIGTLPLQANVWTHLAQTYDGTALRLYVNGVQVASSTVSGTILTSPQPLEIGGDHLYGQFFQGLIDEVRIYNVALTPTQIQSDMSIPIGGVTPLATLSATTLDFAQQAVGLTTATTDVILSNIGNAPMMIGNLAISGPNSADFRENHDCGPSLPVSGFCTIHIAFTPSSTGTRSASLVIDDDAPNAPHVVALTGTGLDVLVSPTAVTISPGQSRQFTATTLDGNSFVWGVDGQVGGSAASGTITQGGLYTAPASPGTHTITATTADLSLSGAATAYVVSYEGTYTFHNDLARTGANLNETVLTLSTVNPSRFGKLYSFDIDGIAHASPLYVPNVNVANVGLRNVVYIATEHNSIYAFDADGLAAAPYWKVSFINPAAGITTVPAEDTGECCDIAPEIGITGTPVIDPATQTLYVVAKTKEVLRGSTDYVLRLHALDIRTGAEKFGGPVILQASVSGDGLGSVNGRLDFLPARENQRPALTLSNGVVYIGFSSHGDVQPYHGWILGYDASTLQQVMAHCVTPDAEGAGIWMSGAAFPVDADGNLYYVSGDGTFDADTGGRNFGDTYVKIAPDGTVVDYFTPHNQGDLDVNNIDLGSAGIMLLPDQPGTHPHLMVSAGKNGAIALVDRDNLGHYNAANDNQIVQSLEDLFPFGTPEPGNYSAPVYFNGRVYFSPVADNVQAFSLTNGLLSTAATARSAEIFGYPGGTLSISATGSTNGILWALEKKGPGIIGTLRAYDATNIAVELYNSDQSGSRDTLDEVAKYSAPLVANGKVYVGSATRLTVFGPLQ